MERTLYILDPEFWTSPLLVAGFVGTIFMVVLARYLSLSAFYAWVVQRITGRQLIDAGKQAAQIRAEIKWSAISSAVFAILSAACYWAWQHGYTRIYTSVNDYPLWYFFASIVVILFGYETYYYWLHRWMHLPGVYRIVHKVHHDSIHTSVFTSFSFHPLEAVLQFILLPVIVFVMPVHYLALTTVLMLMTMSAIINHAGAEIFPKGFDLHPIGRWLIGSTHHDLHHREFRKNFGLYFTFWDKWMNTESDNFHRRFSENTSVKKSG